VQYALLRLQWVSRCAYIACCFTICPVGISSGRYVIDRHLFDWHLFGRLESVFQGGEAALACSLHNDSARREICLGICLLGVYGAPN